MSRRGLFWSGWPRGWMVSLVVLGVGLWGCGPAEKTPPKDQASKPAPVKPKDDKPPQMTFNPPEAPAEISGVDEKDNKKSEDKKAEGEKPADGKKPADDAGAVKSEKPATEVAAVKPEDKKPTDDKKPAAAKPADKKAAKDDPALAKIDRAMATATTVALPDPSKYSELRPNDVLPAVMWMPKPTDVADSAAASEAEMKPYKELITNTDNAFEMVPIKGGKFKMGSPDSEDGRKADEGPQFEVEIEPFWMGKYEVTWDNYELWGLNIDPNRRKQQGREPHANDPVADAILYPTPPYTDMSFGFGKDGFPAICMTQLAAKMYCKWLSAKTGRYYRLPTEAEWEYACRAGTTTAYSFGDDPEKLKDYGWFMDNSKEKYNKLGKKQPNAWGLYDMHGNVAEWVLDQGLPSGYRIYDGQPAKTPLVPGVIEYNRVVRGGSWTDDPEDCRSAARRFSKADWKKDDPQFPQSPWYLTDANWLGVRLVRPLRTPTPEEAARYDLDQTQLEQINDYYVAKGGRR